MEIPSIGVLSYNRPDFLRATLVSLRDQSIAINGTRIHLFQDGIGATDPEGAADAVLRDECIDIFKSVFPGGNVLSSDNNLGIALNMDRAEHYLFEDLGSELAFIFEDDMVLHHNYISMLLQLSAYMLDNDRVGYVAAYGDHHATIAQQKQQRHAVIPMNHKWGFALSRRQWLRQKPYMEEYLQIASRDDYRRRDHDAIYDLYRRIGYGSQGTSQDAMKDVCGAILGTVKLMCKPCFGRYIGSSGVHFTPEIFAAMGYPDTRLFGNLMPRLRFPNNRALDDLIARDRAHSRTFA